jgi:type II secretory pathway component GspD/PulD (secretin)
MLMMLSVAMLAIPGVLLAQEEPAQVQDRVDAQVRVINLKYYAANEMSNVLQALLSQDEEIQVIVDENANRLILRAPERQMAQLVALIEQLDVQTASAPESQSLLCRVYMVELLPGQSDPKPFRVVLRATSSDVSVPVLRKAAEGKKFVIDRFKDEEPDSDVAHSIHIQGRAASVEVIMQVLEKVSPSGIVEMELDEKTSDLVVPAAQISQLSEQLRQHIQKLLGADVQTVGYWFGGMSSPGEIRAPIGPWSIELKVKPTQTAALAIEVRVTEWRNDSNWSILENSIQGKAGKPIIIGYNRELNGSRTMGAMVILLEADTAGAAGS